MINLKVAHYRLLQNGGLLQPLNFLCERGLMHGWLLSNKNSSSEGFAPTAVIGSSEIESKMAAG